MPAKREAQRQTQMRRDLQLHVMRVADEYVGQTSEVLDRVKGGFPNPADRLVIQNWKLQQATAAYTAASGPNPVINALDLVVLASLSRMVLEDEWVHDKYGAKALPVQEAYSRIEVEAWELLDDVLKPAQREQLRAMLVQWRAEHPHVRVVAYIHFSDFAHSVGEPKPGEEEQTGNLFSLLGLDPLSSLDPAVREIGQTRELAERSIYYFQRAPTLLDMQIERLTYELAAMPEAKGVLADADRLSLLGSAADNLARELPIVFARERRALVAEVMQDLNERTESVGTLALQLRDTLKAATDAAQATDKTLATFARVQQLFATNPGTKPDNSAPFDIRQYTEMMREATVTAQQLNALAERAGPLAAVLKANADGLTSNLNRLLDRAFMLILMLIIVAAATAVGAGLLYRRLNRRFSAPGS
ncbi:MAG: hypothetical protein JSR36_00860 [Proteobacteria bacterium]|nr:hypothetical protein [Pseudomonadota bacterium]